MATDRIDTRLRGQLAEQPRDADSDAVRIAR